MTPLALRMTLPLGVVLLAHSIFADCVGDGCPAEPIEPPQCDGDECALEEALSTGVNLLQHGLRLEGGPEQLHPASRQAKDPRKVAAVQQAGEPRNGSVATTPEASAMLSKEKTVHRVSTAASTMEEYNVWADTALTCEDANLCTCSKHDDAVVTLTLGLEACKSQCLDSDVCVAMYCEGTPYEAATCNCHQYPSCDTTRTPMHEGVTYKKTEEAKPSICSGSTTAGSTAWEVYNDNGIYVDVDTSSCGFSDTPVYVTSLGGGGHFQTTGSSEVYKQTATGFRTYIRSSGATADTANSKNWHVNWVAHPVFNSVSGSLSCAGGTTGGSTDWQEYTTNGIYVNVDTSSCGFAATPVYITGMSGGSIWETTGSSEVYNEAADGFRTYINAEDVSNWDGITPDEANSKSWRINWVAHPAGEQSHDGGRSCAGATAAGSTSWVQYNDDAIYVDVDTSSCSFTATPAYVTSLGGTSHWKTTGSSEVYLAAADGFRIYIHWSGITPDQANTWEWHVNWMADEV